MAKAPSSSVIIGGAIVVSLIIITGISAGGIPNGIMENSPTVGNDGPPDQKAISYVLLCTEDSSAPVVNGAGSEECPEDSHPFVRWEWKGNSFVAEGDAAGTTMSATSFKEPGEPTEAEWTSDTYEVTGAVVGAGGETCFSDDPDDDGTPDEGSVVTC